MTCPENDQVKATVTGFLDTSEGQIAFARAKDYGKVTFSTSLDVWSGNGPYKGQIVILSQISLFGKGWRAMKARPFVLADEE